MIPPTHRRIAGFTLKDCTTFAIPPPVVSGDDALYVGCISQGNARSYIFRLPPAAQWPEGEQTLELEPVAAGASLDEDSFTVVGRDVYFHDVDANDDDHVYRVSAADGKPTRVLDTHVVYHKASDGKTLFVHVLAAFKPSRWEQGELRSSVATRAAAAAPPRARSPTTPHFRALGRAGEGVR